MQDYQPGNAKSGSLLRWRGSSTDACGTEGAVYLVWGNRIGGGGLSVLDRFGGECLDFHYAEGLKILVGSVAKLGEIARMRSMKALIGYV